MENNNTHEQQVEQPKKASKVWIWIVILAILLVIFYSVFGFIAIQPIGAIPDGITLMVVRAGTKIKFFDSADSMCLRMTDGVSLLCRLSALSVIADMNIVARLPYSEMVYLSSTGGMTFEK